MIDAFRGSDSGKMSMLSNVQTFDIKHYDNVKSFFEHIGLYVGLVAYTAAGAKVNCRLLRPIQSIFDPKVTSLELPDLSAVLTQPWKWIPCVLPVGNP